MLRFATFLNWTHIFHIFATTALSEYVAMNNNDRETRYIDCQAKAHLDSFWSKFIQKVLYELC